MTVLFFLTLGLLFGLGLVYAQTDRQDVMANWNTRRCDPFVVISSNLYKPVNDSRSATAFATENLQFCTNKLIQEVFTKAINPFLALLKQQLGAVDVIQASMAAVKGMIGNFFASFSKILGGVYQRFLGIGFNFRKTFVRFLTAMNRAFGIAIATLYAGLSALTGIFNLYDAVIKIVIIVLGILAGLVILLFLAFFPVIPIIMTTIAVLVAGGVAGAGGFSGVFCFSPRTEIQTERGVIQLADIKLGDKLADGGLVEGILRVNGAGTHIYSLHGVHVSGDHLVYYEPLATWILVKDHPQAVLQVKQEPVLICLNTTTREIPIQGLRFRDWEELPAGHTELQKAWNSLVGELLGTSQQNLGDEYPLLSGAWKVKTPTEFVALRDVFQGMKVLDGNGTWTSVLGLYEGLEEVASADTFWTTNSIWWKDGTTWNQKPTAEDSEAVNPKRRGFHLVTSSGTFKIFAGESQPGQEIRDFTEVGQSKIAETYEWMKHNL